MTKKSFMMLMLFLATIALAAASCSGSQHTSSSTQDVACDFTKKPGKQQFHSSKAAPVPAPETPIGRR
jgi:hypothetical protein